MSNDITLVKFERQHITSRYIDLFNDKIVDPYLNGELGTSTPKLIKAF